MSRDSFVSEVARTGATVEIGGITSAVDFLKRKFHGLIFPDGIIRVSINNLEPCLLGIQDFIHVDVSHILDGNTALRLAFKHNVVRIRVITISGSEHSL